MAASASICGSFKRSGSDERLRPPRRNAAGTLVDAHQPRRTSVCSVDEGRSRLAQLGQRQFSAAGCKFGKNGLLLLRERGQPRSRESARQSARCAAHRARRPRSRAQSISCASSAASVGRWRGRSRAQRGDLDRLARSQPLQYFELQPMFLGRDFAGPAAPPTAQRSTRAISVEKSGKQSRPRSVMR